MCLHNIFIIICILVWTNKIQRKLDIQLPCWQDIVSSIGQGTHAFLGGGSSASDATNCLCESQCPLFNFSMIHSKKSWETLKCKKALLTSRPHFLLRWTQVGLGSPMASTKFCTSHHCIVTGRFFTYNLPCHIVRKKKGVCVLFLFCLS